MDSKQPNDGRPPHSDKKKQKKRKDNFVPLSPSNAPPKTKQEQSQSKDTKQPLEQKQFEPKDTSQQPAQKQSQSKDANQSGQKQTQPKDANQSGQKQTQPKNAKQKQSQSKDTKQQPGQKQSQPTDGKQKPTQKQPQSKGTIHEPFNESSQKPGSNIEQQISLLKNNLNIPKRKNPMVGGTLGRKTEIDVNHLPLNLEKLFKKTIYHIDVAFEPELPKKLLRNALEEFNRTHYPNVKIAFDGRKNMFSTKELKSKCDVVHIVNDENGKTIDFKITTSTVNAINMNQINDYIKNGSSNNTPGEAFQALDIVLKNRPFSLRFTNVGRSFFPVPRITPVDLGEGMELWKGFFQSPVIGWKPFLNIDVAHKGFPKHQPLVNYIANELGCRLNVELDPRSLNTLGAYVKGLKVDFMVPNAPNTKRSFKVVGLLDTASKFFFDIVEENKSKKTFNVVQYFKAQRQYVIQYPNLPCLHVGNVNKKTAIPIELCTVQKGQLRLKKLTENQTSIMVKNAARPPSERRQTIENCIRDVKYNTDSVLQEFGIEVGEKFSSVPARVLDQPSLAYAYKKEIRPNAGVWRADKFAEGVKLNKWVVLNLDNRTRTESIRNFESCLINSGKGLNVAVSPMHPVISCVIERHWRAHDIQKAIIGIFNKIKNENFELVVVVIPDFPSGIYAIVKQASELHVGILTQCIKSRTMFKMTPSTTGNILLKINSKLNGINHTLALRSSPSCMSNSIIFGADVTHPSPDQTSIPSVAAVAASHDINGSQYNMEWRLQSPKVEIIQHLEDIVHKQLIKYKDNTKCVPRKIFYFRDGVSEGQFLQLLEYELVAIRRACLRLNSNYKPAVTILVVQKRHHTRMFPKFSPDFDGKFGNVPSGTIIDTQITHPTELDFYLCSHASIQGTSRPTKYHLIWDDNNLTEDALEQLTFYLCFMFARCTRSVSYPAPTYYAHLAAFRARAYLENKNININQLDKEQANNQLNHIFTVNTPMFFV